MVHVNWAPPPRILVGELNEPGNQSTARHDRVDGQASGQHLRPPAIDHRIEHGLIGTQERNIVGTQDVGNEPGQFLSHDDGRTISATGLATT
ncbi:hypothetical protein A5731_21795 [Mycolicibacterium conceptionense]|uniref:Uncharacterized protein n=1 Tax=Mycolicibacterium conceptionense TaxID=451644 RepID=A0A1A1Y0Y6_9MYCO|nr:hypothetical protein A5718_06095 [Mycolicibacterium conceptionense]OBE98589.1 hypothetical protein A5731_21795 [Mycolicibacterium conceptionense]OBF24916.1 hypothetical protein A5726_08135 [Mycolicibacterium conceptionense]OBF31068.1 hypothetical protein A5720_02130 [Mycolicibacterium conceptionense]OBH97391.1 hypothetical protein A5716_15315 [Mycolicibacterium conceptionense]